jgi:aerotaxis receptor
MRHNGPVTMEEYVLQDDEVIITHTDPGGRITYANAAFARSSEFSLEEALGQPQNIIRHPDMPPEVFADMWRTIRSGTQWIGVVKNRRKSGGFYWVRANVTPILENGRIVGYMSVRVRPTREEIRTAEALYAAIRSGTARHIKLRGGKVVDMSLLGRLKALTRPSLRVGNFLVVGSMWVMFGAIVVASLLEKSSLAALLGSLGLAVALANMLYIHGRVVRPLQEMRLIAYKIVGGDTQCRFPRCGDSDLDELSTSLNQLNIKIDGVLKDARQALEAMSNGAIDVLAANTQLSSRTNDHAAGIESAAAALDRLTSTVDRNTSSAQQAAKLSLSASQATERGRKVVSEVVSTIEGISQASSKISDIVSIIDDIAFQTNLLALNAAVEAARAGEQGRGFAVVAQEVRSLAQRSASAAKEIKDLINASSETVARGTLLADQAEAAMREVVASVKRVTDVISEIEAASREQAAGIGQINHEMNQMDQIKREDADMAEQVMHTARELHSRSMQVLTAVSAFSFQSGVALAQTMQVQAAQRGQHEPQQLDRAA